MFFLLFKFIEMKKNKNIKHRIEDFILKVQITTKVVYFCHLLKCFRSLYMTCIVDQVQTASVQFGLKLFASILQ